MNNLKRLFLFSMIVVAINGCQSESKKKLDAHYLHDWNTALEKGIINDFFSPPVAGRMYTYPNLITYIILTNGKNNVQPLLKNFPDLPKLESENRELVALYAFYFIAKKMVYSYNFLDEHLPIFEKEAGKNFSKSELEIAKIKAEEISQIFLQWVAKDGYKESRSDTKFKLSGKVGAWKPTPNDFADAMEPNWTKIRTFFIDSSAQFTEKYKPYPFDIDNPNSDYYKDLKEVKNQVDQTTEAQLATSKYWDCSPLAVQHKSHAMYGEKKLTPGGHWLNIGRNISKQKKDHLLAAAKMYTLLSLSICDGFIACWDAKYHYDYIRPITAIQEHWDSDWETLILTPNFPEYPSGHSVISGVASTVLAGIYGDEISFTDNAEQPFGMEPRKFNSFTEACNQAAMSRFWAGIHYRKAIEDGVLMGREIGESVIKKTSSYAAE